MENQGKRPDQIKYSTDVTFYATLGLIIMLIIISLFD
jgi:hypothetical protein